MVLCMVPSEAIAGKKDSNRRGSIDLRKAEMGEGEADRQQMPSTFIHLRK